MRYRKLGKTGFSVSLLALGTVELGLPYGFYRPGESGIPDPGESIAMLLAAFEKGVNFLDTAPAYGESETILGQALQEWGQPGIRLATKIGMGKSREEIRASLRESRRRLQCEVLDLVQLHNPTAEELRIGCELELLQAEKEEGGIRAIGASVYGLEAARAALCRPQVEVLQVALNLLDQQMASGILPRATRCGVGILVRSALLKGILSDRRHCLPPQLSALADAAGRAEKWARRRNLDLPAAAIRFCLTAAGDSVVLLGIRSRQELDAALRAAEEDLPPEALEEAGSFHIPDSSLTDPRTWPAL